MYLCCLMNGRSPSYKAASAYGRKTERRADPFKCDSTPLIYSRQVEFIYYFEQLIHFIHETLCSTARRWLGKEIVKTRVYIVFNGCQLRSKEFVDRR